MVKLFKKKKIPLHNHFNMRRKEVANQIKKIFLIFCIILLSSNYIFFTFKNFDSIQLEVQRVELDALIPSEQLLPPGLGSEPRHSQQNFGKTFRPHYI